MSNDDMSSDTPRLYAVIPWGVWEAEIDDLAWGVAQLSYDFDDPLSHYDHESEKEGLALRFGNPSPMPNPNEGVIDANHLAHQREWSERTFGPGPRTLGVIDHIRKELIEIEADPHDINEWVDVIILAFDGAWRHGGGPQQIIDLIKAKQARNEARTWPDWRTMSADEAIEHDRSKD